MTAAAHGTDGSRLRTFLRNRFAKIREINRKYAVPRIRTRGLVSLALLFLRLYLIVLIGILFFKFATLLA